MDWNEAFGRAWSSVIAQVVLLILVGLLIILGFLIGGLGGVEGRGSIWIGLLLIIAGVVFAIVGETAIWIKAVGDIVNDIVYEAQEEQEGRSRQPGRRRRSIPRDE